MQNWAVFLVLSVGVICVKVAVYIENSHTRMKLAELCLRAHKLQITFAILDLGQQEFSDIHFFKALDSQLMVTGKIPTKFTHFGIVASQCQ